MSYTLLYVIPTLPMFVTFPYLINRFGADHVLIGTDYPFDMGEYDPVEHVYQVPGLSSANRDLICGGNALRLMHMTEDECK